jgi:anti-sigma B factor antagonist
MVFNYTLRKEFNVNIVSLSGELIDKNQSTELTEEIDGLIANGELKYVFDLSELKYINSSGLNVLIHVLTKARKAGGEAVVANVSKKVNELLIITKLNTVFTVTNTVEIALSKLK